MNLNPDEKEFFVNSHIEKERVLSSIPVNSYSNGIIVFNHEVGEIIIPRTQLCLSDDLDPKILLHRNVFFIPDFYHKSQDKIFGSIFHAVEIRSKQLAPTSLPLLHVNDHLVGVVEYIYEQGVFVNLGGPVGHIPDERLLTKDIVPGSFIEVNIARIDYPKEQISLTEIQTDDYGNTIYGGIDYTDDYLDI
ncbi:MAG: hypothetical protein IKI03_04940 [Clostridia bacterium]|nr:hypothetical protein [Clostridia bacterium]